jgi:inner membrane protein
LIRESSGGIIKRQFEPVRDGRLFHWVAAIAAKRWIGILLALYAFGTDALTGWHGMNFAMRGLLDEPAHLATALVILGALVRVRGALPDPHFGWTMLACSVLIDLDHLPAEFGTGALTNGTPRPYTHALWTVIALTLAWATARFFVIRSGRSRPATVELILAGAAWGVAAHFVRDIATAPMSFWWPVTDIAVQVPYWWYVVALSVIIAIGPVRRGSSFANVATRSADDLNRESNKAEDRLDIEESELAPGTRP